MRAILFTLLGGFLLGATSTAILFRGDGDSQPAARAPRRATGEIARRENDGAVKRVGELQARVAELEAALRLASLALPGAEESVTGTASPGEVRRALANVDTLFALVDDGNARELGREILRLLRAGDEGYDVLVEFLHGELNSPRKLLLGSRPLLAALLGLAFHHGEEVAGFAGHLLGSAEEIGEGLNDRLRTLLPAFLAYHGSRFGALRGAFEDRLIAEFSAEGDARWKALAAMTEMGMSAPADILAELVAQPGDEKHYRLLMNHILRRRDRAGLEALVAHLDTAADPKHWSVRQALHTLARLDVPEAPAILEEYLGSGEEVFRNTAELARNSRSIQSALEFLNSPADLASKRRLVRQVARAEPELLGEIKLNGEAIASQDVRKMVENDGNDVHAIWSLVDGQLVAGADRRTTLIWNLGEDLGQTRLAVNSLVFSPDGTRLFTGNTDAFVDLGISIGGTVGDAAAEVPPPPLESTPPPSPEDDVAPGGE